MLSMISVGSKLVCSKNHQGTQTEMGVPIPKQGNIKCSFSKIYESATEVQEHQKGNSRETQPKHKKKPEEKQRKIKRNTGK